jgi:hypothetical protein
MGAPALNRKKPNAKHLSFVSDRRFGVELELNAFDGRNRPKDGNMPAGIDVVANIVGEASPESGAEVRAWEHTNGNKRWVVKPDSSCGMEVVSPPRKSWRGLKDVLCVIDALSADERVRADQRCSVHVHVEVADLTEEQIASIVAWWVKCEPVIIDAMPISRKRNRYCQLIGMNNTFQHDGEYSNRNLIERVGDVKYYSFNTWAYCRGARKTIEFRTVEGSGCTDAYLVKQWVRFLIHFVEVAKDFKKPNSYHEPKNDKDRTELTPWTGLVWLDPEEVLTFLGFNNIPTSVPGHRKTLEFTLSKGMEQTRNWFLARLAKYMSKHKPGGMRYLAYKGLEKVIERHKEIYGTFNPDEYLSPTELLKESLFGDDFRF